MSQEVLIPKMTRPDKSGKKIKIPWTNVIVIFFCVLLMIMSTFVNLNIKHYILPLEIFTGKSLVPDDFIFAFCLIPQIPVVMFICSALGKRLALTSVIVYILTGLFVFPVFALGGGIRYVLEYGFGYILAYIPAVILAGNQLGEKYTFGSMIKAVLTGVLTIHIFGILYMIFIALCRNAGGEFITGWIAAQSGLKIVYDIIGSFVLILIGKYIHCALKEVMSI